jgi:hypothetical protein
MLKELRALWEKCREARDNLDKDMLERDTFHADICACADCEACRDYFYDLPAWKKMLANLLWGEP